MESNFIHLKNLTLAEYKIIYHINDGYSIKKLENISSKHQLLFQKFNNKIQQMNLMLVDSNFPIHLADVALEVFFNRVSTFEQYTLLKKNFVVIDAARDTNYFKNKFYEFILLALYSKLSTTKACNGEWQTDLVYYFKNSHNEIQYFTIFQQRELQQFVFQNSRLEILSSSTINANKSVTLVLRLTFP